MNLKTQKKHCVEQAHEFVREAIPHAQTDQYFKDDISKAVELLQNRSMVDAAGGNLI